MASSRRKGSARAAAAAAAAARQQWKIGDLVLAKMKGFPAWPAMVSEPEKWGFSSDRKKLLVYFYGTKQIAFCNHADIEAFTEEKKKSLLIKRQGKGADFVRAVEEIIDIFDSLKIQNLESSVRGHDGNTSNQEHLEDSGIVSLGKTVKLSSSPNHQLEVASIAECGDKLGVDGSPKSLIDGVNHNRNAAVVDDSAKTISILDQLRQIPLSSTPTTRKRARDALLPSSVTKSSSSLRRSRSSLVNNFTKSQKSSMQADAKHIIDCSARIITLEEPTSQAIDRGEHLSNGSAEVSPILTRGLLEDIRAVRIDGTNSCNGSAPEASKKFEFRDNDTVSNTVPVGDARLNSDVETSLNAEAVNTMRKPFGKQVDNARGCDEKDREMDMPVDGRSLSDSNSRNDTTDKFSNANGDEHLPLVKRARIRMGNPLVEEENLNDSAGSDEKSGNLVISNGHHGNTTLSSPSNNCQLQNVPLKRISPAARKFARSSANSSSHTNFESDLQSCKMNKHHMLLDVEAALPPSKRLHRALEAMSANAAEAETDCPQAPCEIVIKSTECLGSSAEVINSVDESVSFPVTPLPLKASNTVAFGNNTCDLSSSSTIQNLVACCLGSSEVNPVHTNPGKETNILMNASVEIVTDEDNDRFLIKQRTTHAEAVKILPKGTGTRNSQQFVFSPSSGAAAAMSTSTTDCTTSEIDCTAACSDIINVDSSLNDMNEVPSVSSVANFCSLVNDSSGAAAASVTTKSSSTVNGISMVSVSRLQFDQTSLIRDMQNVAPELKHKYKDRTILSMLAPIKDLIAAAQAKRFISRSTSICDSAIDGKVALDVAVSPTIINKEGSSVRGSPSNPMFYHRPASDDDASYLRNSSKTPLDGSYRRGVSKYANHSDAIAARRCFESLLCTLSRTKDSIGRATRLAIDCAKYGIAGEVIDILLQYLETESNLHRRIDLFFLVDSITQCSRCQKGGPGDVYPSLVQAALPRLLAAAAPPGNGALENRRQCLKVLRLWLERRTLPELSLRHHIRELEYGSEASLSISYSRRPPRMERPLNDPVREMEGMLVDEYGSNASFQLPQFLDTRILEGDEGSASDDKSFEAVTPDRNAEINSEKGITLKSSEKHRLILEDVDGELEMEDVSPPCGPEAGLSTCLFKGVEIPSNCNHKCEKNNLLSFAPPLPEERPPSPPPLPSSPPPPSSNAVGKAPDPFVGLTAVADSADFCASYATPNQLLRPISQQQRNSLHCSPPLSDMPSYYSQGYAGHSQPIPQLISSCTSSGSYSNQGGSQPVVPVGSNSQSIVNKVYHLQPPPPVVSNQFSYIQAQPSHRMHASNSQSSYSGRFHQVHDNQRGTFYGDGDQSAFHPSVHHSEALVHNADGGERPHAPSFYGAHSDISSAHCQDWPYPPRTSNYPAPASRSSLEDPTISGVSAAYWRSR